MAEMTLTTEKSKLTAEKLGDFARAVPEWSRIEITFETKNLGDYSDDHRDFVTFKAEF